MANYLKELKKVQALVSAFEWDIKSIIRNHLGAETVEKTDHLQDNIRLNGRTAREGDDAVDHLNLGQCIDVCNRNKELLPELVQSDLKIISEHHTLLIEIRNRAFHVKVLDEEDIESLIRVSEQLEQVNWPNFSETVLSETESDLSFLETKKTSSNGSQILNNLQPPDYSDTTLIGRKPDVEAILNKLRIGRDRFIQIVGPAGIGKSALATQVLYKVIERGGMGFDCVLWVSLKFEKLTTAGIEEIRESMQDLFPAVGLLSKEFDKNYSGAITDLASVIAELDMKILICIDNLESTTGEEFGKLVEALPDSVTYLLTSRYQISVLPYTLQPLPHAASMHLLRKLGDVLQLAYIQNASNDTLSDLVSRFGNPTLYLKLLCLGLQSGRTLQELEINLRLDFLDYAVNAAISSTQASSNLVLATICEYKKPITYTDLLYATDLDVDVLNEALMELNSKSLAAARGDSENQMWVAQDLVKEYVRAKNPFSLDTLKEVKQAIRIVNDDIERSRRDRRDNPLHPISVSEENPANTALRQAIREKQAGNDLVAQNYIRAARQQSPDYFEVDRFEAWLLREVDIEQSRALYYTAYQKASSSHSKAVVAYHFGLSLLSWDQVSDSITYLKIAANEISDFFLLLRLAIAHSRNEEFERAHEILMSLDGSENRRKTLQWVTALCGLYRRWAEFLMDERADFRGAWQKILEFLVLCDEVLQEKREDSDFLVDAQKIFYIFLPLLNQKELKADKGLIEDIEAGIVVYSNLFRRLVVEAKNETRDYILNQVSKLWRPGFMFQGFLNDLRIPEFSKDESLDWIEGVYSGSQPDAAGGYGFLKGKFGERIYFRLSALHPYGTLVDDTRDLGRKVSYRTGTKPEVAISVWFD